MDISRIARHLRATDADVKRRFPAPVLEAIEAAIAASEARHGGQIRFAVEAGLEGAPLWRGQTARERAIEVFSLLHVWDTEHNSGLLIYLLLADRAVEIVADRGVESRLGPHPWGRVCRKIEAALSLGDFAGGVLRGVEALTRYLEDHYPRESGRANELPDKPVML